MHECEHHLVYCTGRVQSQVQEQLFDPSSEEGNDTNQSIVLQAHAEI